MWVYAHQPEQFQTPNFPGCSTRTCLHPWRRSVASFSATISAEHDISGYVNGNPRSWPFDHWIQQSPNVVIVSIYYRLHGLGFLSAPSFTSASNSSASSPGTHNAGFLDQREALRWVQKNIGAFGGDPARVTIDGESAGGSSVELHLVARGAVHERLFSGAIAQSVYRTPVPTPEDQKARQPSCLSESQADWGDTSSRYSTTLLSRRDVMPQRIRRRWHASGTRALAQSPEPRTRHSTTFTTRAYGPSCALPPPKANFYSSAGKPYHFFHPVVDGEDFIEYPTTSLLHGRFQDVPLMVGCVCHLNLFSTFNLT